MSDLSEGLVEIIASMKRVGDRYSDLEPIGDGLGGHFSVTFRAWDSRTKERVVLKFLRLEHTFGYPAECFKREVAVAKQLVGRENIVQLRGDLESLVVEVTHPAAPHPLPFPVPYFALEEASQSFASFLLTGAPPGLLRRLEVVRDVVRGVNRLHTIGLCHRDLKPDNILLFPGGVGKVADLGLCRSLGQEDPPFMQNYGGPPGHMLYAAPEMIFGGWNVRPLYKGADWFGVGGILFEALTGANLYTTIGLTNNLMDTLQQLQLVSPSLLPTVYERYVADTAGRYPIPLIQGVPGNGEHLSRASGPTLQALNTVVGNLCHFDPSRRLVEFDRILAQVDICIGWAREDEKRRSRFFLSGRGRPSTVPEGGPNGS